MITRSASGNAADVDPSSVASACASVQLLKPSASGPISAYSAAKSKQDTASLFGLVATVRPSMPISSWMKSMPAAAQIAASSSLILREASETSASPAQNFLKPSPVPGPSTVTANWPSVFESASSLTSTAIGSTVDEPVTNTSPPAISGPAVVVGASTPSVVATSATVVVASSLAP